MKPFEYATPASLEEATSLLADTWGKTEVLAGGTDLVTSLKQEIISPERVVSLKNISSLKGIRAESRSVRIGATTTLAELANNAAVKEHFPALVTAAGGVGGAQIMSVGTVGGDLCQRPRCWYFRNGYGLLGQQEGKSLVPEGDNRYHAIFGNEGPAYFVSASSFGPVLIALGARIKAVGPKGKSREIAAQEFFRTPKSADERETALRPNEILTEIEIPIRGLKNATYEVRHRYGLDWPYVTATVAFLSRNGAASEARIVLGHVAPVPWQAPNADRVLNGATISEDVANRCGMTAASGAKPLSGNGYKVQLVKTAVKRAVLAAAEI